MTKDEFLTELRSALSGNVSAGVIEDNIRYYEDYIEKEIRKGKDETEVTQELGSPRLIARTVVETASLDELRGARAVEEETGEEEWPGSDIWAMPWWMILIVIFGIMLLVYIVVNIAVALLPVLAAVGTDVPQPDAGAVLSSVPSAYCISPPLTEPASSSSRAEPIQTSSFCAFGTVISSAVKA